MVLGTEIMLPPRRNSFGGSESTKSESKSPPTGKSHWWFFTSKLKSADSYGGSNQHVATQKLRDSKWFRQDEERLVCAVLETGFIVELVLIEQKDAELKSHYGIVCVDVKKSEYLN